MNVRQLSIILFLAVSLSIIGVNAVPTYFDNETTVSDSSVYSNSTNYGFQIRFNDTVGVDEVVFGWNGAANYSRLLGEVDNDTVDIFYYNITSLAVGDYTYKWYANDTTDNWNDSFPSTSYAITKAAPSLSVLFTPDTNTSVYPATATIQCNITDGDIGATLTLYRNGTQVSTGAGNRSVSENAGVAVWNYSCVYTASQNYTVLSNLDNYFTVTQGDSSLGMTLVLDSDSTASQSRTYPNATDVQSAETNAGDDDCTYELAEDGTTLTNGAKTFAAGSYNITYNATGCTNYTDSHSEIILTVSQAATSVTLWLNGTANSYKEITYPAQSNATALCNISILTTTLTRDGVSQASGTGTVFNLTTLGNGTYNFTATCTGDANYSTSTSSYNLTVLKGTPVIYIGFNGTQNTNTTYTYGNVVNATAWFTNQDNNGNLTLYRNGVNVSGIQAQVSNETVLLGNGTYIYVAEFLGNESGNYTETNISYALFVNKAATSVRLFLNGTEANSYYNPSTVANFTAILNVSGVNVTLFTNITSGWNVTNTTPLINYTTLPSNTSIVYNITASYNGSANYSASSQTYYMTLPIPETPTTTTTTLLSHGGGSGSAGSTIPQKSHTWSMLTPGVAEVMKITDEELGFKQIQITVKNQANNVKITVTKLDGQPASVTHEVSGKVYKYIEITKTNIENENIEKAKIEFQVTKEWLSENNIDLNKVVLNRYTDKWEKLVTRKLSEDSKNVYYEADTEGFSYFAITGDEIGSITQITTTTTTVPRQFGCGNGVCDSEESCSNCIRDCPCSNGYICEDNICKAAFPTKKKLTMKIITILVLVFVTIAVIIWLIRSLRKPEEPKKFSPSQELKISLNEPEKPKVETKKVVKSKKT